MQSCIDHNQTSDTSGVSNLNHVDDPFTGIAHENTCIDLRRNFEHLALAWESNARQCERVARAAYPTEPTITKRCAKVGKDIGRTDVDRRIEALPEHLRGIARDYFDGSLSTMRLGRSTALRGMLAEVVERVRAAQAEAVKHV